MAPAAEAPVPVTVPVKLLAEKGFPGDRTVWEKRLREQLEAASQYFELYCNVRFRVAAVQTWQPEKPVHDFPRLVAEFSKIDPQPGWLAIALVREMHGDPGHEFHHAPQPLFAHLLLPRGTKGPHPQGPIRDPGTRFGTLPRGRPQPGTGFGHAGRSNPRPETRRRPFL